MSNETSVWCTTASVQLDAHLETMWLSWGEVFLPRTAEWKQQEDPKAKKRATMAENAAEKKHQQEEANAEKARQAAQSAKLKKVSQVSLWPSDQEDDTVHQHCYGTG
jgi:hypothetical protein